ncbi:hypothetical protein EVG20_g2340 [Dentipellis fragilis]|uniref:Zn(2)-C6 fungal-type domain-containing protein n=1 Tax=Dentipellis fragilis TaxID=205917 RepID=A0A4Y9ZA38_9AGAM|nr:hypothetical protein EVG20_g2340 [Dentipellis fragilis]
MRGRERGQRQSSLPSSLVRHLRSGPRSPDSATSKDEPAHPTETQDGDGMRTRERDNDRTAGYGLAQPLASAPPATSFPLRPIAPSFPVQSTFLETERRTSLPPLRRENEPQYSSRLYGRGAGDEHPACATSSSSIPHGQPSRQVSPWSTDPEYYTYPPPSPRHPPGQYAAPPWSEGEPGPSNWNQAARPLSQSSYSGLSVRRASAAGKVMTRGCGMIPGGCIHWAMREGYDQRAGYEPRRGYPLADARVAEVMQGWGGAGGPDYDTPNHYPTLPSSEQPRAQRQPNEFPHARAQPSFPEPNFQAYDQGSVTRSPVASGSHYPYIGARVDDYELPPDLPLETSPRANELRLVPESSNINGETKDPYFGHTFPFGDDVPVASPEEDRSEEFEEVKRKRSGAGGKRKHRRRDDDGSEEGGGRGAKRAKTEIACFFCRQRKLKCSGDRPKCRACSSRDLNCNYAAEPRRRGPGKALKGSRSRGPRTSAAAAAPPHPTGIEASTMKALPPTPAPPHAPPRSHTPTQSYAGRSSISHEGSSQYLLHSTPPMGAAASSASSGTSPLTRPVSSNLHSEMLLHQKDLHLQHREANLDAADPPPSYELVSSEA